MVPTAQMIKQIKDEKVAFITLRNLRLTTLEEIGLSTTEYFELCDKALGYSFLAFKYIKIRDLPSVENYDELKRKAELTIADFSELENQVNESTYERILSYEPIDTLRKITTPEHIEDREVKDLEVRAIQEVIKDQKAFIALQQETTLTGRKYAQLCERALAYSPDALKFIEQSKIKYYYHQFQESAERDINRAAYNKLERLSCSESFTMSPEEYLELCQQALKCTYHALQLIQPEHLPSAKEYFSLIMPIVEESGEFVRFVKPEHLKEKKLMELCLTAVTKGANPDWYDGKGFAAIGHFNLKPENYYKICKAAIKVTGDVLEHISPEQLPVVDQEETYKNLCLLCVKKSGIALQWVKKEKMPATPSTYTHYLEIAKAAVFASSFALGTKDLDNILFMEDYTELCMLQVKKHKTLEHIKPGSVEKIDYEQCCYFAINRDPYQLRHVDLDYFDLNKRPNAYKDLCINAVSKSGMTLNYVRPDQLDSASYKEICLASIESNPRSLKYVKPERLPTLQAYVDICKIALSQSGFAIGDVNCRVLSAESYTELALIALQQTPRSIINIKRSMLTEEGQAVLQDSSTSQQSVLQQRGFFSRPQQPQAEPTNLEHSPHHSKWG